MEITNYHFKLTDNESLLTESSWTKPSAEKRLSINETIEMQKKIHGLNTVNWKKRYIPPSDILILDVTQWKVEITYEGETPIIYEGDNAYPDNWDELVEIFGYKFTE